MDIFDELFEKAAPEEVEEQPQEVEQVEEPEAEVETPEPEPEPETETPEEPEPETPAEPEPETPPEPQQINVSELFGEHFKDVDSVKAKLKQAEELEKKIIEYTPTKFANETLQRLNNLLLSSPEMDLAAAYRLSSLNREQIEKMDDKDVMRLRDQIDNPEIADDDRLLSRLLERKYTLSMPDKDSLDDMSEEEIQDLKDKVRLDAIRLRKDASVARREFNTLLEAVEKSGGISPEQIAKGKQDIKDTWSGVTKDIVPEQIPIPIGDWKKEFMKFSLDKAQFAKIAEGVPEYASNAGLPLTDENLKVIRQSILEKQMFLSLPKIIEAVVDATTAKVKLEAEKRLSNVSTGMTEQKDKTKPKDQKDPLKEMGLVD